MNVKELQTTISRDGTMGLVLSHDYDNIAWSLVALERLPESYKVHRLVKVAGVWILEYSAIAFTFDSGDDSGDASSDWTSGFDYTGASDNLDSDVEHWTDNGWQRLAF